MFDESWRFIINFYGGVGVGSRFYKSCHTFDFGFMVCSVLYSRSYCFLTFLFYCFIVAYNKTST